jgi:predicted nucleic acid-binding Zn ribbon protein
MKNCENCKQDHDGSYGSGRFCSSKCARGFSTKAKRKEINEKVSASLGENELRHIDCPTCGKKIKTRSNTKTYCSRKCIQRKPLSKDLKDKLSKIRTMNMLNGKVHSNYYKVLNSDNKEITVQGTWEFEVANRLKEMNEPFDRFFIKYDGHHRYTPDFYLPSKDLFIEVKGWWKDRDIAKMNLVMESNPQIKILLIDSLEIKDQFCKGELKLEDLKYWGALQ